MVTYPSDWPVVPLGTVCEVTSSKRVFENEWTTTGIPFFRTRDIVSLLSGEPQKDRLFISNETYNNKIASSGEPQKGDLLVTGVGTIGLPYLIATDRKMYFKDGNILWLKRSDSFFPKFLYLLFLSKGVKQQISDASGFTTVGTFTIKNAKSLIVPLPPLPEQEAIAETITAFDTHIENLSALIEKKRAVRDGALEDLISGRTRLEGYGGQWVELEIGKAGELLRESISPQLHPLTDFTEYSMISFDEDKSPRKCYGKDMRSNRIAVKGEVLLFNKLNVRQKRIWLIDAKDNNAVCSSEFLPYCSDIINLSFLANLLQSDEVTLDFIDMSTGTSNSQKRIRPEDFMKYKVHIPMSKDEQKAIASVLTVMDEEITALEEERDKIAQIREGAMDDLLTGRVRLKV